MVIDQKQLFSDYLQTQKSIETNLITTIFNGLIILLVSFEFFILIHWHY